MSLRGIFAGVLMLTGLEAVVSSQQGAQRFGGILTSVGRGVRYFLDPTVPAIPDHRKPGSGGGSLDPLPNLIPDIPGVPQGPITKLPFSPISYVGHPVVTA